MNNKLIKKINDRLLEIDTEAKQITLSDSRFYKIKEKYYPSITHVLQCYPKGKHFEDWLKKVGYSANYIVRKASDEGTEVHTLIEKYLKGEEIYYLTEHMSPKYDSNVWQMFLKFVEWYDLVKPEIIATECILYSDELGVSGTVDLICRIDGELWIIDFKTSNYLSVTYDLQVAIYGKCYSEIFGEEPKRFGILWLKSNKRRNRKGFMQGKGWEIVESPRSFEENINIFKSVKTIFDIENKGIEPDFVNFKTYVKKDS